MADGDPLTREDALAIWLDAMDLDSVPVDFGPEDLLWIDTLLVSTAEATSLMSDEIYNKMIASITGPIDEVALATARTMANREAATLATNMAGTQLRAMGEVIASGLEKGLGPKEIAQTLDMVKGLDAPRAAQLLKYRDELEQGGYSGAQIEALEERRFQKLLRDRRETIARTEARQATEAARQAAGEREGAQFKVWFTSQDDRVSDECQANEAEGVIPVKQDFSGGVPYPPQHPNCLVGETPVFSPDKFAAFVATYSGVVVDIICANGSRLTVTPNHMLLTPHGFARAQSLRKGDEVFHSPSLEGIIASDPNDHNSPIAIKDVVASLAESRGMVSMAVPLSPEYLHGDGRRCDGDIDVIAPDRFLRGDTEAPSPETINEIDFRPADVRLLGLPTCRNLTSMLFGLRDATDGGMGIRRESEFFVGRHAPHPDLVGIASRPKGDPTLDQSTGNHTPANAQRFGQGQYGFASDIAFANRLSIYLNAASGSGDATALDRVDDSGGRDAALPCDFLQGFGRGLIETTDVVEVGFRDFTGHVYDLQSFSSLYIASGLISSNCRCSVNYITSDAQAKRAQERADKRTENTEEAKEGDG